MRRQFLGAALRAHGVRRPRGRTTVDHNWIWTYVPKTTPLLPYSTKEGVPVPYVSRTIRLSQ